LTGNVVVRGCAGSEGHDGGMQIGMDRPVRREVIADDAVNEGMDSATYSLLPIIMTDPAKNPKVNTMTGRSRRLRVRGNPFINISRLLLEMTRMLESAMTRRDPQRCQSSFGAGRFYLTRRWRKALATASDLECTWSFP